MVDLVPRAVCLGEAMIMLAAETGAPLEDVETFRRSVGGAECNVAGGLAALGHPDRLDLPARRGRLRPARTA